MRKKNRSSLNFNPFVSRVAKETTKEETIHGRANPGRFIITFDRMLNCRRWFPVPPVPKALHWSMKSQTRLDRTGPIGQTVKWLIAHSFFSEVVK